LISLNAMARQACTLIVSINSGESKMVKGSADRQPNAIPVSPEKEKQAAERRWLEDALEDDEVYEALVSLRAERQAKNNG